jgi:methyl-accepting chemotaxis protein
MLGLGKLQVLEQKLDIYEDLSKEMLDKLERAVGTISENSNKVAVILERHDNRLDEVDKSQQLIIKMIEEVKEEVNEIDKSVRLKFHDQNKKIEENQKWIWMAGAVLTTAVTILQVLPNLGFSLTQNPKTAMIQGVEAPVNVLS